MKHFIVAALAMLPLAAHADESISKCDLHGFSIDTDPKGTNIRSAPNAAAPIVGHFPSEAGLGRESRASPQFDVIGSKNGWLLIQNVDNGGDPVAKLRKFFKGPGWVSGALVGFTVGTNELRSAPSNDAPIVAKLINAQSTGPDSYVVKRVNACSGTFADITILLTTSKTAKPIRGWAGHVCQDQLTTCDSGG
jgi:hypothetical protein